MNALDVSRARTPGRYLDGRGLYLQVSSEGARSWIFRYRHGGRKTPRDMGLGSLDVVSLASARAKAATLRAQLLDGIDPIEAKREAIAAVAAEKAKAVTFRQCAERYIGAHAPGWRNAKHADQWRSTLHTYAYPVLGAQPIQTIDIALVIKVLEPIWLSKTETASRLRGRIEAIIDWATARGFRQGDNPARWRGRLENLLPARSRVQRVKHHPALPYSNISSFMKGLREQPGLAAQALELLILTATRVSEVVGAKWSEINLDLAVWTIPADRIKAGREHRIPLSKRGVALLKKLAKDSTGDHIFPGEGKGAPHLNPAAISALLKRMKRIDITVHGFRSTFRDWAAEQTNYPREVAEMALAHAISDKVEAAYRRGDLMSKRKNMMEEWAVYCGAKR
ncbi:site-specific integrase [Ferrovibrio sp.]|uniref:tyrosine-type recombinase/integrase n=1 Tax=Ferrovibrio sp. TaxID=1917215 RepID=UPI0025BE084B|nr:site-specific integrase [Ferrovibrio sp.]